MWYDRDIDAVMKRTANRPIPGGRIEPGAALGFAAARAALLPHLGIVISGGNTLLVHLGADLSIRVVARTVDDAAGEAFDKSAKLLGLGYPGGPALASRITVHWAARR